MAFNILQVEYYNITVQGKITDASNLLSTIAGAGVNFHAFKATPLEPDRTQFTLFAKDSSIHNHSPERMQTRHNRGPDARDGTIHKEDEWYVATKA
jgi:hypothetical protein